MRRQRCGFTLPEVLVALGVMGTGLLLMADLVVSSADWSEGLHGATNARQLGALSLEVLRHEVAMAGRSIDGDGIVITDRAVEGGDLLGVRYRAEAYRSSPSLMDRQFFAARDAKGLWSLYGQSIGSTRQPWILGVRRIDVTAIQTEAGEIKSCASWHADEGARAIHVDLLLEDGTEVGDWLAVHTSVTWAIAGDP